MFSSQFRPSQFRNLWGHALFLLSVLAFPSVLPTAILSSRCHFIREAFPDCSHLQRDCAGSSLLPLSHLPSFYPSSFLPLFSSFYFPISGPAMVLTSRRSRPLRPVPRVPTLWSRKTDAPQINKASLKSTVGGRNERMYNVQLGSRHKRATHTH